MPADEECVCVQHQCIPASTARVLCRMAYVFLTVVEIKVEMGSQRQNGK